MGFFQQFSRIDPFSGVLQDLGVEPPAPKAIDEAFETGGIFGPKDTTAQDKQAAETASKRAYVASERGLRATTRADQLQGQIDTVGQMQEGISGRLSSLRENRDFLTNAAAQPALQNLAAQEGLARRQVGMEGSLGDTQRSNIASEADLARQSIQSQALGQQLQSEQGLQQIQNEFTAMFNDMANTGFTDATAGIGAEIDAFKAEKGRSLDYDKLATDALKMSNDMMGRLASGMGSAFSEQGKAQRGSSGYQATRQDYRDNGVYDRGA